MTENEALEMIKSMTIHPNCEMLKAFEFQSIVIKALEDLEQYRAIGLTPTMVQDTIKARDIAQKRAIENAHIVDDYQEIGTVDEFKALKEKSVAKKVVVEHIPKTSWTKEISHYLCPSCRSIFSFGGKPYCSKCGQKLDWQ